MRLLGNLPKDSRGRESITLSLVVPAWLALLVKFLVAGLTLPVVGVVPAMSATEFGMAMAGVLAIWLGREWTEKKGS
jgi:hypothetical protein